jgi:hypothetical protein
MMAFYFYAPAGMLPSRSRVAQVSNLLYRRFPIGRACDNEPLGRLALASVLC